MSILGLRAGLDSDSGAQSAVKKFFEDFGRGRIASARPRTTKDFEWFGKAMDATKWEGPKLASWVRSAPISVSNVRALSEENLTHMPQYAIERCFGGPLTRGDSVVFADVKRGSEVSTVIAVVAGGARRMQATLLRVVDPDAFVRFANFAGVLHHMGGAETN